MPTSRPAVAVGKFTSEAHARREVRRLNGQAKPGDTTWQYATVKGRPAIVPAGKVPVS